MQQLGWAMLIGGAAVLIGFGAYYTIAAIIEEAPLWVSLGAAAIVAGVCLLMGSVVRDRLNESKSERSEERKR